MFSSFIRRCCLRVWTHFINSWRRMLNITASINETRPHNPCRYTDINIRNFSRSMYIYIKWFIIECVCNIFQHWPFMNALCASYWRYDYISNRDQYYKDWLHLYIHHMIIIPLIALCLLSLLLYAFWNLPTLSGIYLKLYWLIFYSLFIKVSWNQYCRLSLVLLRLFSDFHFFVI